MTTTRFLLLNVLACLLAGAVTLVVLERGSEVESHEAAELPVERAESLAAITVLRSWDQRRAASYAAGDVPRLRALYTRGSRAGRADARVLRSYLARGFVVRGMRMQVLGLRILDRSAHGIRLRVRDRLVGAVAVSSTRQVALPVDQPSTRTLTLSRTGPAEDLLSWRMRSVTRDRSRFSAGQRRSGR